MWALSLITPPVLEALDTTPGGEVYQHLRLEPELLAQAGLIAAYAAAARQEGERISRRQFITATWELAMESWYEEGIFRCGRIVLPLPPLISVVSAKYLDAAGVEQTWSAAEYTVQVQAGDFPQKGCLFPVVGKTYPAVGLCRPDAVKVRFTAGYGTTPSTVPGLFRNAMLLLVGEAYERREISTIGTIQSKNARTADRIFFDNRAW